MALSVKFPFNAPQNLTPPAERLGPCAEPLPQKFRERPLTQPVLDVLFSDTMRRQPRKFPGQYPGRDMEIWNMSIDAGWPTPCVTYGNPNASHTILFLHGVSDTMDGGHDFAEKLSRESDSRVSIIEYPG